MNSNRSDFSKMLNKKECMLLMVLPATLWFLFFSYLPMAGMVIAFKQYRYSRDGFLGKHC